MEKGVVPSYLTLREPSEIPGLVSFWEFAAPSWEYAAVQGEPYTLSSCTGRLEAIDDPSAPLRRRALQLQEGQWLKVARRDCPRLNFHGTRAFSVVAWIRRDAKSNSECEFVAGMWNESQGGRQYGLFLNIGVWQQADQICGHLSNVGGPTPGYRYCIDGPVGATPVTRGPWTVAAMSYDGQTGCVWRDGFLDSRPGLNPYPMAGGLFDGGEDGSDFTVGAVDRGGAIGNFFAGAIAGLAVYERALTPAEHFALSRL